MTFPPVSDLVPHSPPTIALDELVAWQPGDATLRTTIREHGLLVHGDGVDSCVMLELMAQAAAACLGHGAFRGGGAVRVGMVVACRRFTIVRPRLRTGERLDVRVACQRATDDISSFEGEVRDERGELVSSALMTLVHAEKPPD